MHARKGRHVDVQLNAAIISHQGLKTKKLHNDCLIISAKITRDKHGMSCKLLFKNVATLSY